VSEDDETEVIGAGRAVSVGCDGVVDGANEDELYATPSSASPAGDDDAAAVPAAGPDGLFASLVRRKSPRLPPAGPVAAFLSVETFVPCFGRAVSGSSSSSSSSLMSMAYGSLFLYLVLPSPFTAGEDFWFCFGVVDEYAD